MEESALLHDYDDGNSNDNTAGSVDDVEARLSAFLGGRGGGGEDDAFLCERHTLPGGSPGAVLKLTDENGLCMLHVRGASRFRWMRRWFPKVLDAAAVMKTRSEAFVLFRTSEAARAVGYVFTDSEVSFGLSYLTRCDVNISLDPAAWSIPSSSSSSSSTPPGPRAIPARLLCMAAKVAPPRRMARLVFSDGPLEEPVDAVMWERMPSLARPSPPRLEEFEIDHFLSLMDVERTGRLPSRLRDKKGFYERVAELRALLVPLHGGGTRSDSHHALRRAALLSQSSDCSRAVARFRSLAGDCVFRGSSTPPTIDVTESLVATGDASEDSGAVVATRLVFDATPWYVRSTARRFEGRVVLAGRWLSELLLPSAKPPSDGSVVYVFVVMRGDEDDHDMDAFFREVEGYMCSALTVAKVGFACQRKHPHRSVLSIASETDSAVRRVHLCSACEGMRYECPNDLLHSFDKAERQVGLVFESRGSRRGVAGGNRHARPSRFLPVPRLLCTPAFLAALDARMGGGTGTSTSTAI